MAPYIIHLFRGIEFHTGIWRELILPLEQQGWNLRFLSRISYGISAKYKVFLDIAG